jgi:hypothetical protein
VSDSSQGPGWWQASDGKWYPPEQAPGYQPPSPAGGPYGAPYSGGPAGGGGSTDIGSVLSYAWNKFVQNIGEWVILWLIVVVISIIMGALVAALAFGGGFTGGFSGIRFSALGIVLGLISGAVTGVLIVVLAKAANQAVTGGRIDIGQCFQLTGNNIAAGVVFGLIFGVANSLCGLLAIPVFLLLGFLPILSAVEDKGAEAISESVSLATSRPAETMLLMLRGWFFTGCCFLIGTPVVAIGAVYLLKQYRGQPVS